MGKREPGDVRHLEMPLCGDPECGGCPTERRLAEWNREQYRQANLILGLPADFGLPEVAP